MKKIILSVILISSLAIIYFLNEGSVLNAQITVQDTKVQDAAITEILAAHNRYRTELNIPPLKWSEKLAKNAKAWSDRLASEGRMYHSSGTGEGENLWMGTAGYYSYTQMVDGWGGEKKYYKDGVFPNVSKSGNWADVGHYTQVIWRNTTEVGCGKSTGRGTDFFACRYSPPGNYLRQKVY